MTMQAAWPSRWSRSWQSGSHSNSSSSAARCARFSNSSGPCCREPPLPRKTMETTVYIPTLRAGQRLAQTLESLERQVQRPRVVVVDNSTEGLGADLVRERFPWALSVAFGVNLGFGAALNRAVREVPGDPIVF